MATEATTIRRTDVVLDVVEDAWRTTSYLVGKLYDRGFNWSARDIRVALHVLYDAGRIECQRAASGYRWRLAPSRIAEACRLSGSPVTAADMTPLPATATELLSLSAQVAKLAEQLATAPRAASPHEVVIGEDVTLIDLQLADERLASRIVRRAVYETGKALLDVLDGWIDGAVGNCGAMGHEKACSMECGNRFYADDIRTMVNDAMRLMGAPEHRLPQAGE